MASAIDTMWESPEAKEASGSNVPDGQYVGRVDLAEIRNTNAGDREMLHMEIVITEGDQANRRLFRNAMLGWTKPFNVWTDDDKKKVAQSLGYLKSDLKTLGIDIYDPEFKPSVFLDDDINWLLDLIVEVEVKTKVKTDGTSNTNIYLNGCQGRWAEGDKIVPQGVPGVDAGFDPFASDKK